MLILEGRETVFTPFKKGGMNAFYLCEISRDPHSIILLSPERMERNRKVSHTHTVEPTHCLCLIHIDTNYTQGYESVDAS